MSQAHFQVLQSPVVDFVWGAWRARSIDLQRDGWEFEREGRSLHDPLGRDVVIYMRHRSSGMTGIASCPEEDLRYMVNQRLNVGGWQQGCDPEFHVRSMAPSTKYIIERHASPLTYGIDMEPRLVSVRRFTIDDIFAKRETPQEEIIVEPQTVASLLEQIKKLQAPELAAIRERNRLRDETRHLPDQELPQRTREVIVPAQIVTLRKVA